MIDQSSTICAIATPYGMGAISVIRLSGPKAFEICDSVVHNKKISDKDSHTVHLRRIYDDKEFVDEVLITIFKAPNSYTGEDVIEISCHGSLYIQQKIVELLIKKGARHAQPGEFTMRAFLNGKMDLSQAEAVADLIQSSSKSFHDVAINQFRGGYSQQIDILRQQLLEYASLIELELDFSEEDVEFANRGELLSKINEIQSLIKSLIESFQYGNVVKKGIPVAIIGQPNIGKSTLLNAILKEEKAIVSEIPGTTRDVIEDYINIKGIIFRFIDTAGIRHTSDSLEALGIQKTFSNIEKASIILFMVGLENTPEEICNYIQSFNLKENQRLVIIINKIDKYENNILNNCLISLKKHVSYPIIPISAKKGINLHEIHDFLLKTIENIDITSNSIIVTNIRHYEALKNAYDAGVRLIDGINSGLSNDLVAEELRQMLYHLGTITGQITTDEILQNIFKNFCIGK